MTQSSERYRRAMEIFDEACELTGVSRAARLSALCGDDAELRLEVESLLTADKADHRLVDSAEAGKSLERIAEGIQYSCDVDERGVQRIGAYHIVREIGRGGMGIIYEAQQESPYRRVALKVLRPGLIDREMLKRFQHEAHVLGQLQHPGIAQIFEAGIAETPLGKQPYLVMELIEGEPLDRAAESNELDARQRFELMARVCDAVQHAHQKGIIHRDLKPTNVLVTRSTAPSTRTMARSSSIHAYAGDDIGQPKVLDFGIARVTNADMQTVTVQTEIGQLVGTLAYMSPEQVEGNSSDLDTRCDVYALGVMAYELLAGQRPHEMGGVAISEAARRVREEEPLRLGSIDKRLRGDIETIVAKALEKDRDRRYGSAAELAADIRRHLNDQPIEARPSSTFYQIRKFAKRNKGLVGGLVSAFAILLVGLGVTAALLVEMTKQKNDAIAARKEADSARDAANEVTEFQLDQLAGIDVPQMGKQLQADILKRTPDHNREELKAMLKEVNFTDTALTMLELNIFDRSVKVIEEQFGERPLIQSRLYQAVAGTERKLGLLQQAEEPQRRTVEIRRKKLGNEDVATLDAIGNLGGLLVELGRFDEAEPLIQETIETGRRILGEDDKRVQGWIGNQIGLLFGKARFEESLSLLKKSLAVQRKTLGADSEEAVDTMGNMTSVLITLNRLDEAEPYAREVMEVRSRTHGEENPKTLSAASNLAAILRRQGKLDEAVSLYRSEVDKRRRVQGNKHPRTLAAMNNLASVMYRQGRLEDAEPIYREVIESWRTVVGIDHPETILAMENLGALMLARGRFDESIKLYNDALDARRRLSGNLDPETLLSINHIAGLLAEKRRYDESIPMYTEVIQGARKVLGEHHENTIAVATNLIEVLSRVNRWDDAEPYCRLVLEAAREASPDGDENVADAQEVLGKNLIRQSKTAEAEGILKACIEIRERILPKGHWKTWNAMSLLGEAVAADPARHAEAMSLLNSSYDGLRNQTDSVEGIQRGIAEADARRKRFGDDSDH